MRELADPAVAFFGRGEAAVEMRREGGRGFLVELHERVKPDEGLVDDGPVAGGAGVAHAELHPIGGAGERAVFCRGMGVAKR